MASIIVFISETIKSEHSFYATFDALRYGNINLTSKFHVTLILDEYCKKGFFFLLYPIKIFILIFYEVLTLNRFTINTSTQMTTFIFLIYIIMKKRYFIYSKILNIMLNAFFSMHLKDNKSGFIICRTDTLKEIFNVRFKYINYNK